jgi:hypothetical protein
MKKDRKGLKKALVTSKQTVRIRGVSARDVLLPWESKDEFEQLYQELAAELSPHGRMEEDIVFDVAILRLRKYRLLKMKRIAELKDPFFIELMQSGKKSWSAIRKHLREQDEDGKTISGAITNTLSELTEAAKELAHAQKTKGMEQEEVERTEQKLSGIMKVVFPVLHTVNAGPSAQKSFEQAYLPEYNDAILKYEAAIDARIDKLLGRLVNLKEYKRVYGANKLPPSMPASPPLLPDLAELTAEG